MNKLIQQQIRTVKVFYPTISNMFVQKPGGNFISSLWPLKITAQWHLKQPFLNRTWLSYYASPEDPQEGATMYQREGYCSSNQAVKAFRKSVFAYGSGLGALAATVKA